MEAELSLRKLNFFIFIFYFIWFSIDLWATWVGSEQGKNGDSHKSISDFNSVLIDIPSLVIS